MSFGQEDSLNSIEDFSQFSGEMEELSNASSFCTSKILGGTPSKLISLGYDVIGPTTITATEGNEKSEMRFIHGTRALANFPVISKSKLTVNLGANYWQTTFQPRNIGNNSYYYHTLLEKWHSAGINFTIFKPLDRKHYLLLNTTHDYNSNFINGFIPTFEDVKHGATLAFGWKKHDRSMFAIGISRTYRAGQPNIVPIILYNYSAPNRKWGVELLMPARAHYRRNVNARSIFLLGYELEGNSYTLYEQKIATTGNRQKVEWRRSELRFRAIYEISLQKFIWLSVQAGYCHFNTFNIDQTDIFRGFGGNQSYLLENNVNGTPYAQVSINLVSP